MYCCAKKLEKVYPCAQEGKKQVFTYLVASLELFSAVMMIMVMKMVIIAPGGGGFPPGAVPYEFGETK